MKQDEDLSYRMFRQDYYLRSFRDYAQPTHEKNNPSHNLESAQKCFILMVIHYF